MCYWYISYCFTQSTSENPLQDFWLNNLIFLHFDFYKWAQTIPWKDSAAKFSSNHRSFLQNNSINLSTQFNRYSSSAQTSKRVKNDSCLSWMSRMNGLLSIRCRYVFAVWILSYLVGFQTLKLVEFYDFQYHISNDKGFLWKLVRCNERDPHAEEGIKTDHKVSFFDESVLKNLKVLTFLPL